MDVEPAVEPQMLKGALTLLLLSLLAQEEDYGYAVVQRLRRLGLPGVGEGTVYPALTRLEGRGLLEARLVREGRGPARRYYRTAAPGLVELDRLLASWRTVGAAVARAATGPAGPTSPSTSSTSSTSSTHDAVPAAAGAVDGAPTTSGRTS